MPIAWASSGAWFANTPRACAATKADQSAGNQSLITGGGSWCSAQLVGQPVLVYGGQLVPHGIQRDAGQAADQYISPPY
jgi:hypothetical protein